jgi:hypothetical protein
LRSRLFKLASVLSLVLCAATISLWTSDYEYLDYITWPDEPVTRVRFVASSYDRTLYLGIITPQQDNPEVSRRKWGFAYIHTRASTPAARRIRRIGNVRMVGGPLWVFVLMTAVLPAWHVIAAHHARRLSKRGLCASCGYDLRATPERCPECGTPATQAKPQPAEGAAA